MDRPVSYTHLDVYKRQVVNSRAYDAENLETGLMTWQIAAIAADVVLGVGILALEIVAIKRFRKRLAEEKAAVAVEN